MATRVSAIIDCRYRSQPTRLPLQNCRYRIAADPFDKLRAGAAGTTITDDNARRVAISFGRTSFGEAPSPTRRLFFRGYCRSTFSRAHFWSGDRIDKTRRRRRGTVVALTYTRRARR